MLEKISKISIQVTVTLLSVLLSYGLLFLLVWKEVPAGNRDMFNILVGVVIGSLISAIVGWLFTTNKNSKPPSA